MGKLTPEQLEALKVRFIPRELRPLASPLNIVVSLQGFWTELFRLLDAAPEHGSTDVAAVGMGAQLEQSDGDKIPKVSPRAFRFPTPVTSVWSACELKIVFHPG